MATARIQGKITIGISTLILGFIVFTANTIGQENCTGTQIFTAKSCVGDTNSAVEATLLDIVNKYRLANGRSALKPSTSLSILANRRVLDLQQNLKTLTHSWSNCKYDIQDEETWPCVLDAPTRLNSGYTGQGYETLFKTTTGKAQPPAAIAAWSKSALHSSIILNQGTFANLLWDEVGVAIDGQYAVLWFGYPGDGLAAPKNAIGLGVSYDQAIVGLARILSVEKESTTADSTTWRGLSSDKKLSLEISGTPKEISGAEIGIAIRMDSNGKVDAEKQLVVSTFLRNIFPEWRDIDTWLETSLDVIAGNKSAMRGKIVRKIAIELEMDGPQTLKLTLKPFSKPTSMEIF